jgi:DNA-binding transcriptional regulator YdaS (Cro superfamily)
VTHSPVSQWKRVLAERVLAVEAATGVSRHTLRPDIYPAPASSEAA